MNDEKRFLEIINSQEWLIDLLKQVQSLNLQNWYVAAGAIRNTVWNVLHDYDPKSNQNDVDVVYFNSSNLNYKKDIKIWKKLKEINPSVEWNVFNQARAHIKDKKVKRYNSTEEAIAYWSETPTCIGITLENNKLKICAPHGLEDLMNLIVRSVPKPFERIDLYMERIKEKQWQKTWPKLRIY